MLLGKIIVHLLTNWSFFIKAEGKLDLKNKYIELKCIFGMEKYISTAILIFQHTYSPSTEDQWPGNWFTEILQSGYSIRRAAKGKKCFLFIVLILHHIVY